MDIFEDDDVKVTANINEEVKDAVFQKIISFYKRHQCFSGESICQMDGPIIESPRLLADIADEIIKFKEEVK
jgi:hypothetical protein